MYTYKQSVKIELNRDRAHLPRVRTNWGKQTFIYQASKDWNNLDNDIKNSKSLSSFKAKLKTF